MLYYHILLLKYPKAYFFEDHAFFFSFPPLPVYTYTAFLSSLRVIS